MTSPSAPMSSTASAEGRKARTTKPWASACGPSSAKGSSAQPLASASAAAASRRRPGSSSAGLITRVRSSETGGALMHVHYALAAGLVGDAEAVESAERSFQVLARVRIKGVKAAAGEKKQQITAERTARAQLTRVVVTLAQQARLREAAAVPGFGEFHHDPAQMIQLRCERFELVGRPQQQCRTALRRRCGEPLAQCRHAVRARLECLALIAQLV